MGWKLFADLAEAAGTREPDVAVGDADTAGEALDALLDAHPALAERVLDGQGRLRDHVNLLRNGKNVGAEGLDTPIEPDDELALFPPVSGG
ncbi:ubiquitin-like small modifier protein 1 [Halorarum salinum]|uniref:MoaD/ThiS family protein n=1 Tax=Halorarum salinum TaxID=2743089 RepID=A0A7D5QEY4_9EURY|nr:ubiquitin-like small modifier protein 1 [Halobaculum salinum]QLG63101.1 MoaD/ThiS family protein [Halobaculum salinum]